MHRLRAQAEEDAEKERVKAAKHLAAMKQQQEEVFKFNAEFQAAKRAAKAAADAEAAQMNAAAAASLAQEMAGKAGNRDKMMQDMLAYTAYLNKLKQDKAFMDAELVRSSSSPFLFFSRLFFSRIHIPHDAHFRYFMVVSSRLFLTFFESARLCHLFVLRLSCESISRTMHISDILWLSVSCSLSFLHVFRIRTPSWYTGRVVQLTVPAQLFCRPSSSCIPYHCSRPTHSDASHMHALARPRTIETTGSLTAVGSGTIMANSRGKMERRSRSTSTFSRGCGAIGRPTTTRTRRCQAPGRGARGARTATDHRGVSTI